MSFFLFYDFLTSCKKSETELLSYIRDLVLQSDKWTSRQANTEHFKKFHVKVNISLLSKQISLPLWSKSFLTWKKNSSTPLQWDLSVILPKSYSSDKLLKQINEFIANVTNFPQSSFSTGYAKYRPQLFPIYRFKTYLLNHFQEN